MKLKNSAENTGVTSIRTLAYVSTSNGKVKRMVEILETAHEKIGLPNIADRDELFKTVLYGYYLRPFEDDCSHLSERTTERQGWRLICYARYL